jgi:hypothetical protein
VLRTPYRGQDYPVALAGESDWVRNVRAADGRAVLRRRGRHQARLVELPLEQRPAVLAAYLRRGAERAGTTAATTQARAYFRRPPQPDLEELAAIAKYYPVFRVTYLGGGGPGVLAGSVYGASRKGG